LDFLRLVSTVDVMLGFLVAAVVRDFLVVEKREVLQGVFPKQRNRYRKQKASAGPIIEYLPKTHYKNIDAGSILCRINREFDIQARSAHSRSHHLRRLPAGYEASLVQKKRAERRGIFVPEGYTWVTDALVGGAEREKIYRSRSASLALLDISVNTVATGKLASMDWRMFERYCSEWLKKHNYEVVDRTSAGADGGVDILAVSEDEIVVAQCKHYNKPVGPKYVRELAGTRQRESADRAILMVSGVISDIAREEAQSLGIEVLEGTDLI
jgi:hypothetical protein